MQFGERVTMLISGFTFLLFSLFFFLAPHFPILCSYSSLRTCFTSPYLLHLIGFLHSSPRLPRFFPPLAVLLLPLLYFLFILVFSRFSLLPWPYRKRQDIENRYRGRWLAACFIALKLSFTLHNEALNAVFIVFCSFPALMLSFP